MTNEVEFPAFENNIGKLIKITGKVAKAIWQHIIIQVDSYPNMNYIDLNEDHQIVVYSKGEISCADDVEMVGKVIKVTGKSKDPRSKINDENYFEYQFVAESWKCVGRS